MQILLGEVKMADVQLPRLQRGMANQRAAPYPVSGEISGRRSRIFLQFFDGRFPWLLSCPLLGLDGRGMMVGVKLGTSKVMGRRSFF